MSMLLLILLLLPAFAVIAAVAAIAANMAVYAHCHTSYVYMIYGLYYICRVMYLISSQASSCSNSIAAVSARSLIPGLAPVAFAICYSDHCFIISGVAGLLVDSDIAAVC